MNNYRRLHLQLSVLWIFLFHLLTSSDISAQTFSYRTFDAAKGLPGNYVNALGQDKDGFLWVGLETGLFRFDGFSFHRIELPDTLTTGYPATIHCDETGKMWVGFTDGSLFTWLKGSNIERVTGFQAGKINRIVPGPDGKTWIITQTDGIYVSGSGADNKLQKISTPEGIVIFDISFVGKDSLMVATQDNLHVCAVKDGLIVIVHSFSELEYVWVQSLARMTDNMWAAGTDGAGLWLIRREDSAFRAEQISAGTSLENARIPSLLSYDSVLLAATREEGVVSFSSVEGTGEQKPVSGYNIGSGLPDNDIRTIFRDYEGNLWIGLFNKGLAAVTTNAFSFHNPGTNKEIIYIGEWNDRIVMGTRNGLYDFDPSTARFSNFREMGSKTGGSGIASWCSDNDGNLFIGTVSDGLYIINEKGQLQSFYRSGNPGQDHINGIATDSNNIWLATLNGVVLIDRATGKLKSQYTTWDKLPHNNISALLSVKEGEVLVATETDMLCYISEGSGVSTRGLVMEGSMRNRIQSLSVSDNDGTICAGTLGNGLFRFKADTLFNHTTADGLLSNYCYSVHIASDGRIWTGHEKGFSVINTDAGTVRIFSSDFGVKGDCLPNAITETADNKIFIGTTEGAVMYDYALDRRLPEPPKAGIISVRINGIAYQYRPQYNLPYRSSYTIEINYAGISLRDPLNVLFRTKLENFDEDWGPLTDERSITYKLRDGHYHFVVEALAGDNRTSSTTASFDLTIQSPFTRSWWFILAMVVLAAGIVYMIILLRERAHRKQREYLENELSKRTAEVHAQKEELEQKNFDITESIKYAKRIQTSVLPDTTRLKGVFKDAFVFFLPRDIVSGDFYWFDWIDKDRFVLICADSTGHGVPGAFMSMIGTALLQDIITRKKIIRPSQILHELDRQIFSTLNQNQEVEASNDGMDIVVCDFNLSTKHLVFASAMRPVILIIDGEQQYIRGNRSAVGGESASEKFYDDQEYFLREGDSVYLFSDGYPDQFGGYGSKKMKVSRLRAVIDEIKELPMSEQFIRLRDNFFEWKGENDQVDDVLFIGLKV